jgi:hypothetical protein
MNTSTSTVTLGPDVMPRACHIKVGDIPLCAYAVVADDATVLRVMVLAGVEDVQPTCAHPSHQSAHGFVALLQREGIDAHVVDGPCQVLWRNPERRDD